MSDKPVVLFLCIHNSGRSLAARVLLDHYAQAASTFDRLVQSRLTSSTRPSSQSSKSVASIPLGSSPSP